MEAVDPVVRRHKSPGIGIPDGQLKREEIDFTQRTLTDAAVYESALVFHVIGRKVLQR